MLAGARYGTEGDAARNRDDSKAAWSGVGVACAGAAPCDSDVSEGAGIVVCAGANCGPGDAIGTSVTASAAANGASTSIVASDSIIAADEDGICVSGRTMPAGGVFATASRSAGGNPAAAN